MAHDIKAEFVDRRDTTDREIDLWPVVVVPRAEIDHQTSLLAKGEAGPDGRREVVVAHPNAVGPTKGLAPGVEVVFGVLNPGESTQARRRNASDVTIVLSGRARVRIDGDVLDVETRDVWTTPTMAANVLENDGDEPFHYLSYSNTPLLAKLEILYQERGPEVQKLLEDAVRAAAGPRRESLPRTKDMVPPIELVSGRGKLLTYEHLVDPDFTVSPPVLWRWAEVDAHSEQVRSLGTEYTGRPLFCLYNEATGARNGTTPSFFATFAFYPANKVDTPHRHSSSAINYILDGGGWSIVNGVRVEWQAGDIMLSAPGWAPHGHASGPEGTTILTIQDEPLQIAMESLIWQENLKDAPILSLGKDSGFQTNLAAVKSS